MKKGIKTAIIVVVALVIIGAAVTGFLVYRHNSMYITKDDAIQVAIADAGIDKNAIIDVDADFESNPYSSYYEVEIDLGVKEYEYVIDAQSGEILATEHK